MQPNGQVEAVEDEAGRLVTQTLGVLKVWREYVEELGKEDPIDGSSPFDDAFAQAVHAANAEGHQGTPVPELDRSITWEEVHDSFRHLKLGKATGPDGVPAELLMQAGVAAEQAFTELFNYMWHHLVWPEEWTEGVLVPLYKGKGSKQQPTNFRLIAIVSVLAKAFEKILDKRLRQWAERVGMLSDLQGGFREFRSTLDQMFILMELIAHTREQQQSLYLTFIDVRKAYDRVWRQGLWYKMEKKGIPPRMRLMMQRMYERVLRRVLINGETSDQATIQASSSNK